MRRQVRRSAERADTIRTQRVDRDDENVLGPRRLRGSAAAARRGQREQTSGGVHP